VSIHQYQTLVPQAMAKRRDLLNRIALLDQNPSVFARQGADQLKVELKAIDKWLNRAGKEPVTV